MPTIEELASQVLREFAFLAELGFHAPERETILPAPVHGAFQFRCVRRHESLVLKYLDLEFWAVFEDRELFGAEVHAGFATNVFSREHLAESLPAIARAVRIELPLS